MDIQTRKLEFIQEFLKIQSEEVISRFEKLLQKEDSQSLTPFTLGDLEDRINQSENDFKAKNFKTSSQLIAKYK